MSDTSRTDGPATPATRAGLWHRLYHGETTIDFVALRKWGFVISGVLLALSVLALGTRGLNLGIEFQGGVTWEFTKGDTTTDEATAATEAQGIDPNEIKVQELSSRSEGERIRVTAGPQDQDTITAVRGALADLAGVTPQDVSVQAIGPSWGDEITNSAVRALVVFFVLISAYIAFRFEWKMAVAALAAVVHDIGVSVGIYAIFGFNVSPATVIAFLTILGYSLYDTIVVFDKVHENTRRLSSGKFTYTDVVNISMNQTLMRSLNTSVSSVLPVLSLLVVGSLIMGATALQDFAVALLVGMITGAYSSIFIATPVLAILKEREPRYRQLRARVEHRDIAEVREAAKREAGRSGSGSGAAAPSDAERTPSVTATTLPAAPRPGAAAGTIPPRPRKKKRR